MDDVKQGYRDVKNTVKEQVRKIDGETPADQVGDIGDDIKDSLGNIGDTVDDALKPTPEGQPRPA